jgi:hypothetical protein
LENFIRCYDEAISSDLCDELIEIYKSSEHKVVRNTGIKHNTEAMLPQDSPLNQKLISDVIDPHLSRYYKENDFRQLAAYKKPVYEGFAIKKYEPNTDIHDWHVDSSGPTSFRRVLAIQCYLNTVDEGGHTEFKLPDNTKVQPLKGRLVFFPTLWTHVHRGAPPLSGPKYSMNNYLLFAEEWVENYQETVYTNYINSPNKRI